MRKYAIAGLKLLLKLILYITLSIGLYASIVVSSIIVPQEYNKYVRNKVGGATLIMLNRNPDLKYKNDTYGGTAFYVKAKSGKTVVITNRHICDDIKEGVMFGKSSPTGRVKTFKVLEKSGKADLCVLSANEGNKIEGLDLADKLVAGEKVNVTGHPSLMEKNQQSGEIFSERLAPITSIPHMKTMEKVKECLSVQSNYVWSRAKQKYLGLQDIVDLNDDLECVSRVMSGITNIYVESGNSGSSVTNANGEVVAIVYAKESEKPYYRNWALTVPLRFIKEILSKY